LALARGWSGQGAVSCWTGQVGPTMVTPWTPLSSGWGGEVPLAAQAAVPRATRARMSRRMGPMLLPTAGIPNWFPLMRRSASDMWLTEREPRVPGNGLASTCGLWSGDSGPEESGQISLKRAAAAESEALALLDHEAILRLRENKPSKDDST
jgi:hypothetical protein